MSDQMKTSSKRSYRKRKRAELEDETRQRITEAAMELHGSVGPAKTTISAVADRAGVQRATLYRHFPTEEALFGACSAHWAELNPRPEIGAWVEIDDPGERLRVALGEVYGWYGRKAVHEMLERTTRDASLVPAMAVPVARGMQYFGVATDALMRGRPERGARRKRVAAAIGHALAFTTWRSLVRQQGLSNEEAAELIAGMVRRA
jgi:AcrR family transcriptional regulator